MEVRGFEPLASSMRPRHSSQLSYTPEISGLGKFILDDGIPTRS